jgi:hypothetical protein
VAVALAVVALGWLWLAQRPSVDEPLAAEDAEKVVDDSLSRLTLPRWSPEPPAGASREETAAAFEPPPVWRQVPVWDTVSPEARDALYRSFEALEAGRSQEAASYALDAVDEAPDAWLPRYQAGLALMADGDEPRAARELGRAEDRLPEETGGERLEAARLSTYLALGQALAPDDCLGAIGWFKQAVGALDGYKSAAGVAVTDTNRPFVVEPIGRSNYDLWLALVETYARCPAYPERYGGRSKDFRTEYRDREARAVTGGPFPEELADCIGRSESSNGVAPARCWQISNLSQLVFANRRFLPDPATGAPPEATPTSTGHGEVVQRLAGAVARALVASESPAARERAPLYLALLYRDRPLDSLRLTDDTPFDEVEGIAWYLTARWQGQVGEGRPETAFEEIDAQIQRSGPYGAGLATWRDRARETLRDGLVEDMKEYRGNEALASALAIRNLDAPYLGPEWKSAAAAGWRPWGQWLAWAAGWLALVLVLAGVYRLVVVPYALYTTDFYREEFTRRHEASKKAHRPFTRREIEERGGGS